MTRSRRILAWDAPNMDMSIAQLLGCKPTPAHRPNFVALARWFVERGRGGDGGSMADEAAVFVNVPDHLAERLRQWIMWLTAAGYRVFAKPKVQASDIDDEMVAYLSSVPPSELAEVVVASHDAQAFTEPLEALAAAGVPITVLGFAELAGALSKSPALRFVDLETIPGVFVKPLPRIDLRALPPEGRWFEPRAPLGAAGGTAPPPVALGEDDADSDPELGTAAPAAVGA